MSDYFTIQFAADASILMRFAGEPSQDTSRMVINLFQKIKTFTDLPINNLHPAYCSLLIDFDLKKISAELFLKTLQARLVNIKLNNELTGNLIEIPVCYDENLGEDLIEVARNAEISVAEVIQLHTSVEYTVAFIGFSPGFPYLLGLPKKLISPRKKSPRLRVPKGSVAIAGIQTGLYPSESPGGWQLLGRTDIELFNFNKNNPSLLNPGDRVRFISKNKINLIAESADLPIIESSKPVLKIECSCYHAELQDLGRLGFAHLGVSPSGAADTLSLQIGNKLVGNSITAAAVEIVESGFEVSFLQDTWVALTGADCHATIDGLEVKMWSSMPVCAGQRLKIIQLNKNLRLYLCVHNGFAAPIILTSRSGFKLKNNMILSMSNDRIENPAYKKLKTEFTKNYFSENIKIINVTLGPQQDWFTKNTIEDFFNQEFEVDFDLNRRGIRLNGPRLSTKSEFIERELVSEGLANGAIQISNGGQAIILFCEQQTTGGYPKIANVIQADLYKLGQLRPKDKIKFVLNTFEEAWQKFYTMQSEVEVSIVAE